MQRKEVHGVGLGWLRLPPRFLPGSPYPTFGRLGVGVVAQCLPVDHEERHQCEDHPRQVAHDEGDEIVVPWFDTRLITHGLRHAPHVLLEHQVEELLSALLPSGIIPDGGKDERHQSEGKQREEGAEEVHPTAEQEHPHHQTGDERAYRPLGERAQAQHQYGPPGYATHPFLPPSVEEEHGHHGEGREQHVDPAVGPLTVQFPRGESHQGGKERHGGAFSTEIEYESGQGEHDIGHGRGHARGELRHLAAHHAHCRHAPVEEGRFVGHLAHAVARQHPVARLDHRVAHDALAGLALGVVVVDAEEGDDREHAQYQQQPECLFQCHSRVVK